jgi:hypothetical protein
MLEAETGVYPQRPGLPNTPTTYDEFDLDIRLFAAGPVKPHDICEGTEDGTTCDAACPNPTEDCQTDGCGGQTEAGPGCGGPTAICTDNTCETCKQTCQTHCKQHTCVCPTVAPHATCVNTQCAQHTCVNTQCQQHTCANTQCGQHTCVATQCQQPTCAPTCQTHCKQHGCPTAAGAETCVACTHVTCGNQPACKL